MLERAFWMLFGAGLLSLASRTCREESSSGWRTRTAALLLIVAAYFVLAWTCLSTLPAPTPRQGQAESASSDRG